MLLFGAVHLDLVLSLRRTGTSLLLLHVFSAQWKCQFVLLCQSLKLKISLCTKPVYEPMSYHVHLMCIGCDASAGHGR